MREGSDGDVIGEVASSCGIQGERERKKEKKGTKERVRKININILLLFGKF